MTFFYIDDPSRSFFLPLTGLLVVFTVLLACDQMPPALVKQAAA
jgi:hypothetical protein